jgi:ABC-type Fe3+/spermidine/putrescine transport system ATPase subunit
VKHDFPSAAVELRGIRKSYGKRTILDGIDLVIPRGEVLVLVGASGSGKSTILRIVSGIETPDEGEVWLGGQLVTAEPPHRRPVHTVFQNYALFPHLDVARNVAFPLAIAGKPAREREPLVQEALAWVRMDQHARRRIEALSGGEKQRVALARALVNRPQCVLLDEPLSALDPHLRSGTLDLLERLQQELGLTYLFITHDREEALRIGHKIGVLNQGRLEQLGTPTEVYHHPRTAYVASFLGKINWLSGELAGISSLSGAGPVITFAGCRVPLVGRDGPPREHPISDGPVRIGIRPEDLQICLPQEAAGRVPTAPDLVRFAAQVVSRQFFGDSTTLRVRLAEGTELTVDQRPANSAGVGDTVDLAWSAAAMHVFPGSDAPATEASGPAKEARK